MVVKFSEWWLSPTTTDQCGQNPGNVISIQHMPHLVSQLVSTGVLFTDMTGTGLSRFTITISLVARSTLFSVV